KPLVIHADAPDNPTRLVIRSVNGGTPRALTPPSDFVESMSWSPDGSEIAYAASPRSGFSAQYETRIYAVCVEDRQSCLSGQTGLSVPHRRTIVDRAGMNSKPQFSPDGKRIAFISTNGRAELMAPSSLAIVDEHGLRMLQSDGTWISEFIWARDSKSIYFGANEGTFASGAHMFEQPVVRLWIDDGRSERVIPGATVDYSMSLSNVGRRLAYRAVEGRTMGDVFVLDTTRGRSTKLTRPRRYQSGELALVRRHGDLGSSSHTAGLRVGKIADDRLLPWRTDRRRHIRALPAVHAHSRAGRSVSDRSDGQRRLCSAVPDAARRLGIRRGGYAHDRELVGRGRLPRHHGRRRRNDPTRHR
ncbi:MAG: hypothetical protein DMF58_19200, partial [Acidobacteria bacterium]